jgi:hypothetical protein
MPTPSSSKDAQRKDQVKPDAAARERASTTVSRPGGFRNDPDDPTNPNEAIERSRQALRPSPLPRSRK